MLKLLRKRKEKQMTSMKKPLPPSFNSSNQTFQTPLSHSHSSKISSTPPQSQSFQYPLPQSPQIFYSPLSNSQSSHITSSSQPQSFCTPLFHLQPSQAPSTLLQTDSFQSPLPNSPNELFLSPLPQLTQSLQPASHFHQLSDSFQIPSSISSQPSQSFFQPHSFQSELYQSSNSLHLSPHSFQSSIPTSGPSFGKTIYIFFCFKGYATLSINKDKNIIIQSSELLVPVQL